MEIVSIDLSNQCSKGCNFCYNTSRQGGATLWQPKEVINLALDCIQNGTQAVSLGGGEPLEYTGVFDIIRALRDHCYTTITSNGLQLRNPSIRRALVDAQAHKIHLSIHFPDNVAEVEHICQQIAWLHTTSIKPGVNLLVARNQLDAARKIYNRLRQLLEPEQIILLPQRFGDTPTAQELASVSGGEAFQGPSCLMACRAPQNFCSISWDKRVARCSYSPTKVALPTLNYDGLCQALENCVFTTCLGVQRSAPDSQRTNTQ